MPASGAGQSFEQYTQELVEVCGHLPVPILIALDAACTQTRANRAFIELVGSPDFSHLVMRSRGVPLATDELPTRVAARTGSEVQDFPLEFNRDGEEMSLSASAWPLHDADGAVRGSIGVFADTGVRAQHERSAEAARTELRAAEARYRLIAEAMPQFVWIDAPDGSAVYANRRWLEYIGMSPEQNSGYGWTGTVHPEDAARLDPLRAQTLQTGEDFEGECRYRGRDGKYRWFLFRSIAVRDGGGTITSWVGTATDIDRQKRAQEQQLFFATASERLGSTLEERTALERIAQLCVPALADWCTIDLLDDAGLLRTAIAEHANPAKRERLQDFVGDGRLDRDSEFGAPYVARSGEPQIYPLVEPAMMYEAVPNARDRALIDEAGYSSAIIVPLGSGEKIYGTLTLVSADPARLYTDFDLTTALELARRGAIAIEHSRLFEREHYVATTLQRALLPSGLPHVSGLQFDSAYAAAVVGEQVGGDWYDAFSLPNGRIALSIGDVAGHGLAAAVTMGTVRQALRAAALERSAPHEVLARANATLALDGRGTMVTAVFATFDPRTRVLEYAIAGHPRPLVADIHGNVTSLDSAGPPLGFLFDLHGSQTSRITLRAGSTLVFYTDGLIESTRDIEAAEKTLAEVLRARLHAVAASPAAEIIARVLDGEQTDDIAVLTMTLEAPAELLDVQLPSIPAAAPVARALLRRFALFHSLDGDRAFELLCAAGEAVANAIEHPYAGGDGVFHLRAAHTRGSSSIEVRDFGRWHNGSSEDRGRGFTIMKSLAHDFNVDKTEAGTSVRLTL